MDKLKEHIQSVINIYKSGDLPKAEQVSKKLIAANPNAVFLYNLLGLILTGQKKLEEAIEYYEKGLKIDPNFAMIYNNLGLLFFNQKSDGNLEKAENLYKKSITLNENIPEPHTNLGNLYNLLNKTEEAINYHKKSIAINPKFSYAYFNLSNVYLAIGKFSEAKKQLNEAIKLNPNFFYAHRMLSRITKYTNKEKHFKDLEELYNKINIDNTENKMDIAFALGKAYEDIQNFEKSFSFYKEANLLCRKKIIFSINEEKEKFKEIKNIYVEKLFNKFNNSGFLDSSPIFILGMPRSGTTLIEQILSSHSEVFGADEVEFIPDLIKKNFKDRDLRLYFLDNVIFNEDNLKKIGKEYISKMNYISHNSKRTTDKLPTNFLSIGFIKLIFPNSKIVHCNRNARDNIFSIFKSHFPGGKINFAYDLDEIIEYYNLYLDLMKHWNEMLPGFIFNIKYENLISDTELQIRNLLNFCNLDWQNDCLKFYNNKRPIKTASDTQARNKIYNTSIDSWKNYEKYFNKYFIKLRN